MNAEDATVPSAVAEATSAIAAAVDAIAARLRVGRPPRLRRRRLVRSDRGARRLRVRSDLLHRARTRSSRSSPAARPLPRSRRPPPRTTATRRSRGVEALDGRRRRCRRRRQRERNDAVRARCARDREQAGALTACVVCGTRLRARRARRARDRRRRRPGVPRGIDAAQGRHRAEARAQHDLDDLDDPPREDVREPHGRRRRGEREAPGSRPADRRCRTGASSATEVDEAIADADGDARVAIVTLLARSGRQDGTRAAGRVPTSSIARRAGGRAVRLGVEAALVDGTLVAGDVEILGGPRGRVRPRVAERPGHRRARLRGPPGQRLRRRRLPDRRHRRISAGRRSAPRDRSHCLPTDLHHYPRKAAPRRPPRGAC